LVSLIFGFSYKLTYHTIHSKCFFFAEQQCGPEIAAKVTNKSSFGLQRQSDKDAAKNQSASVFCKVEREKER
jgi:hypothetical protein